MDGFRSLNGGCELNAVDAVEVVAVLDIGGRLAEGAAERLEEDTMAMRCFEGGGTLSIDGKFVLRNHAGIISGRHS